MLPQKKEPIEMCITDLPEYKEGYKDAIKDLRIKIAEEINKEIPKYLDLVKIDDVTLFF